MALAHQRTAPASAAGFASFVAGGSRRRVRPAGPAAQARPVLPTPDRSFVAGAAIGAGIGNAIRVNQAYNACMEAAGFIASTWDIAETGPARRYYELTDAGREELKLSADRLRRQAKRIDRFLEVYEAVAK